MTVQSLVKVTKGSAFSQILIYMFACFGGDVMKIGLKTSLSFLRKERARRRKGVE